MFKPVHVTTVFLLQLYILNVSSFSILPISDLSETIKSYLQSILVNPFLNRAENIYQSKPSNEIIFVQPDDFPVTPNDPVPQVIPAGTISEATQVDSSLLEPVSESTDQDVVALKSPIFGSLLKKVKGLGMNQILQGGKMAVGKLASLHPVGKVAVDILKST